MSDLEVQPFDPRKRRLCPDGTCVGVIGPDYRCKTCGTLDEGARGLGPEAFAGGCASDDGEALAAEEVAAEGAVGAGDFDPARKLCPDGACVGVLGPDGRCKVCGRREVE